MISTAASTQTGRTAGETDLFRVAFVTPSFYFSPVMFHVFPVSFPSFPFSIVCHIVSFNSFHFFIQLPIQIRCNSTLSPLFPVHFICPFERISILIHSVLFQNLFLFAPYHRVIPCHFISFHFILLPQFHSCHMFHVIFLVTPICTLLHSLPFQTVTTAHNTSFDAFAASTPQETWPKVVPKAEYSFVTRKVASWVLNLRG